MLLPKISIFIYYILYTICIIIYYEVDNGGCHVPGTLLNTLPSKVRLILPN